MPTSDHFLEAEILNNQRYDPKFSFLFSLQAYFSSQCTITWIRIVAFSSLFDAYQKNINIF